MTESEIRQARIRLLLEQWAEVSRYTLTARERRRQAREALEKLAPFLDYWEGIQDEIEDELERLELAEEGPLALLPELGTHPGRFWILDPLCDVAERWNNDGPMVMGPL